MSGVGPRKIAGQKNAVYVSLYQFECGMNSVNHTVYLSFLKRLIILLT